MKGKGKAFFGVALGVGCMAYALWGVDFSALGMAFGAVSWLWFGAALLVVVFDYIFMGLRLAVSAGEGVSWAVATNGAVMGVGMNNILPAKAGELTKVLYLCRKTPLSMGQALGSVFWERFADLNTLLAFTGFAVFIARPGQMAGTVAAVAVFSLWAGVGFVCFAPKKAKSLIQWVPFEKLRLVCTDAVEQIRSRANVGFLWRMGVLSFFIWIFYGLQAFFLLLSLDITLTLVQALVVFLVGAGSMGIPSTPGGAGVFEAGVVAILTFYGISHEQALAFALVWHMVILIPSLVYALMVFARTGISIKDIHQS